MATLKVTFTDEEKRIITKYTQAFGVSTSNYIKELTLDAIADYYLVKRIDNYIEQQGGNNIDINDIPCEVLAGIASENTEE